MLSFHQILNWIKNNKDSLSVIISFLALIIGVISLAIIDSVDAKIKEIDIYDRQHQTKSVNVEFTSKVIGDNKFHVRYIIVNKSKRFLSVTSPNSLSEETSLKEENICKSNDDSDKDKNPLLRFKETNQGSIETLQHYERMFIPPETERTIDYSATKQNEELVPLEFCIEICSDFGDQNDCTKKQHLLYIYRVDFI